MDGRIKTESMGGYERIMHNRLISKYRYIVEQCFGTLKRRFDMHRARYAGLTKVQGQLTLKSCCFNLLKAVNMMPA